MSNYSSKDKPLLYNGTLSPMVKFRNPGSVTVCISIPKIQLKKIISYFLKATSCSMRSPDIMEALVQQKVIKIGKN